MIDAPTLIKNLDELNDCKGKTKLEWLRLADKNHRAEDVELLKRFFRACYEPSITYGVSAEGLEAGKRPKVANDSWDELFNLLDNLAARKLTGTAAQNQVEYFRQNSSIWMFVVLIRILDRDARVGLGASTLNKVWPGLISCFDVMLAAQFDSDKITFPCFIEPKFDGMRMIAIETGRNNWNFYTRSGKEIESVSHEVEADLSTLANSIRGSETKSDAGLMFDGELMGESFRETMQKARKKDVTFDSANYHVFDWMPKGCFFTLDDCFQDLPDYRSRRATLTRSFTATQSSRGTRLLLPTSYIVGSISELDRYYEAVRKTGHEGLIIKRTSGLYRPRRHHDWMKMKAEETLDLPIIGVERGTGKYANAMGALVVNHKGVPVSVGTGFSDEERDTYMKMWHMDPDSLKGVLAEVGFQEVTPDNSLRHPRFMRLRNDKSTPESAWS